MNIADALQELVAGRSLTRTDMQDVMRLVMTDQVTPAQLGGLLTGLRVRKETVPEIVGAVAGLREFVNAVPTKAAPLLDTCGTGGSGSKLFNISTAAAFVVAASGVHVAKHGNRAMSSKSGSADVLESAGANLTLTPAEVGRCIDEVKIGFMFAQAHHSAVKYAAPVRTELGIHTIFNLIGPMANPADAKRQLLGIADPVWQGPVAEALQQLGSEKLMTVHSNGLDELGLEQASAVVELRDGELLRYRLTPEDVGLKTQSHSGLVVDSPSQSLKMVRLALSGKAGAATDIVAFNAGAALYIAGKTASVVLGVELALDMMASGLALQKLVEFVDFTQAVAATKA